jgi:hypothetical protein
MDYVLIYLGPVPPHVSDCINQICKVDPSSKIYFCGDQNYSHAHIQYVPVWDVLREDKVGNFMQRYDSNPLWKTSLQRVFILNGFLQKFRIPVVHFDTDILIYKPFEAIAKYVPTYNYITPASSKQFHGESTKNFSYCIINDIEAFNELALKIETLIKTYPCSAIRNTLGSMVHEMSLLAYFSEGLLKDLPVIPGNDFDGIIFDAGSYSFYLDGMDARFHHSEMAKSGKVMPGYIIASYLIPLKDQFKIEFDKYTGPSLTVDSKTYSIMSLHMHSKNLNKFMV